MRTTWPAFAAAVNGVSVCSTRRGTCSPRYFSVRFRSIAPGSSPPSSRILNPLQMPSTGPHRAHDRREARHRAGTEMVPMREAAGQDDDVRAFEIRVLVPNVLGVLAEHVLGGMKRVFVAVAAGEHHDA